VMGGCKTETGEGDGPRDMVLMSSWRFVRDVVNYRYMRYSGRERVRNVMQLG
jgi:hypothetical protein